MPGLVHDRFAPELRQFVVHRLRALDLANESRTRLARQDLAAKNKKQHVAEDHFAVLIDGADPVPISVESDTQLCLMLANRLLQITQVRKYRRIGMVVWEAAIHLEED